MSDAQGIHLVLDASAITAYGQNLLDVGETLAEVADEGGLVGVPLLCLAAAAAAAAAAAGAASDMFELLVRSPAVVVFADEPGDWRALAAIMGIVKDLPAASAALAAIDWDCQILTRAPDLYGGLDGGGPVIAF